MTMRILHININYLVSELHQTLIEYLETGGISNNVFVPTYDKNQSLIKPNKNVVVDECFCKWDRICFDYKQWKIARALQRKYCLPNFDLLHAHTLFTDGNSANVLAQKYHLPYVVAVRNTDVNVFFAKAFWLRSRGVQIMRDAEAVIFLSPAYRNRVLERFVPKRYADSIDRKSHIVPNGIDPFWFDNIFTNKNMDDILHRIQTKEIKIIYVGAIEENKNPGLTIQAIQELVRMGFRVEFTIIGDISDTNLYEKLKTYEYVRYVPYQPKEKILEYLRESDIFVMPSHTETFGLVYAEAMSQGVPVIYTRGQGFDGQFEEGVVGFATSDTDADELVQNILKIMDNYENIAGNCLAMCRKFDWSKIVLRYAQIYEECFAAGGVAK